MKTVRYSEILLGAAIAATGIVPASCLGAADAPAAPSFQNLRYDDSQATREQSLYYTKLSLGDASDLSVGGQVRERGETWRNFNFKDANDDSFLLSRLRLNADLRLCPSFRLFVEGRSAFANDRDLPTPDKSGKRPIDEDVIDLENAFGDLSYTCAGGANSTLRLGRQELSFGKERVIGVGDWTNTRRTFDGARAIFQRGGWRVDAFAVRLVSIQRYQFNDGYSGQDLYGVYATKQLKDLGATLDVYALNRFKHNATTNTVDDNRDTVGARFAGKCGKSGFDYEVEGDYQFGDSGKGSIDAWSVASQIGYNVPDCPFSSRLFAGYDYATGDRNAKDKDNNRYDPLYPTGHPFFGLIDVIGRQNIQDISIGISGEPAKKFKAKIEGHFFERAEKTDSVFDAAGNPVIAGNASAARSIGQEIDASVGYQFDARLLLAVGYGHFFAGSAVKDSNGSDIDTGYVSGQYTF